MPTFFLGIMNNHVVNWTIKGHFEQILHLQVKAGSNLATARILTEAKHPPPSPIPYPIIAFRNLNTKTFVIQLTQFTSNM